MDRFFIKGAKKLFSLTRTKIRLAKEANTTETKPAPLPLVARFSGRTVSTVEEAEGFLSELRAMTDFTENRRTAETILILIDIIEGVKHLFEPPEYCALLSREKMEELEEKAKKEHLKANILLLTSERGEGLNLFIGEDPPQKVVHVGRLVSNLASLLDFLLASDYFSENGRLANIQVSAGGKTLLAAAVYAALKELGAVDPTP
jgi:hypothetical protein